MRPTAKDLAEAAGVSLATVDRVLNDRPNVSPKAARLVNEAIERIGFVRNPAAVSLARSKVYRFLFLLPDSGDLYLMELLRHVRELKGVLRGDLTDIACRQIATDDAHGLAKLLGTLDEEKVDGVAVMAPESPQVRDAMARLLERNIKVVQFLSGQEKLPEADFVGIDNFAAGATAGKLMGKLAGRAPGKVMVIAETMQSLDSIQRRQGFDHVINGAFPHLTCLPSIETHADGPRTQQVIARVLAGNRDVTGIYVLSAEARVPILAAAGNVELGGIAVVVHERTPFTEQALRDDLIDAVIAQDPGHAVRSAIRIMRARADAREPLAAQEKIRIEILLKENL